MTYVVLARKWRPKRFDDVVGQEHITNTLANAISQGRVAHGYLFCGPRGVGKTTTARILAKALNCEKGPTPTPCNVCQTCLDVDLGRSLDIIEVDGASTRGIDDIRELRENVRYAPTSGRTKVYIIDEVHMLTREAFNALLKTLEEPPPHVVFVMATTEPFKVPATILSRCQRFDFARIHPRDVVKRLTLITESEGFKVQPDALALLARRSQGGLRDALSTLDQVLGSADVEVTVERVNAVLGILGSDFYFRLTDHLIDGDASGALKLLDEVYHAGADLGELVEELARHLRNVMLLSIGPQMEAVLEDLGPAEVARVKAQAARLSPTAAARLLEAALRAINQARRGEHLRLHLEVGLVEMASLGHSVPIPEIARRLDEIERRLVGGGGGPAASGSGGAPATSSPRNAAPASRPAGPPDYRPAAGRPEAQGRQEAPGRPETPEPPAMRRNSGAPAGLREPEALAGNTVPPASRSVSPGSAEPRSPEPRSAEPRAADAPAVDPGEIPTLWQTVTQEVKKRKMALGAFLIGSRCEATDEGGRLMVEVDAEHAFFKTNLESEDNRRFIEGVIREVFGRTCKYVVLVGGAPAQQAAARGNGSTLAEAPKVGPAGGKASAAGGKASATGSGAASAAGGKTDAGAASSRNPGASAAGNETPSPDPGAQAYDENVQRVMELFDGEITT